VAQAADPTTVRHRLDRLADQHPSREARAVERRQAAALFLIAPMIAVSIAPPAPPAIACETMPLTLRLPDCAAAMTAGINNVTI